MPSLVNLVREISSNRAITLLKVQTADNRRSLSQKASISIGFGREKMQCKISTGCQVSKYASGTWEVYLVESSQVSVTVPGESDTIGARNRLIYVKGVARCESFMKNATHQQYFVECFLASSKSCCAYLSQTAFHFRLYG